MFPIHDENPTRHTPFATYTIIGLNVIVWSMFQGLGTDPALSESLCAFGFIPGAFSNNLNPGAQIPLGNGFACVIGDHLNWLTPLTSMFLHGGWLHLIINMWFLAIFGDNVEDVMGVTNFFIFYLLCGFGAVAVQLLSNPTSSLPMIGASGAIGGVMGAYAFLYPKAPVHLLVFLGFFLVRIVIPAYLMLGYWFLLQLFSALPATGGTSGGVAFWAHVGGFLSGILSVKLLCRKDRLADAVRQRKAMSKLVERIR